MASYDHVDGKISGKFPVFNDLLCFMWCKLQLCAKDVLLNIMKQFYKSDEIMKARDRLYEEYPGDPSDGERRTKHRKAEDALGAMYNIMQNLPAEDPPIFAALNVNNIPYVDLKSVDGAAIVWQQAQMKDKMQEMADEQAVIKTQLGTVLEYILKEKTSEATNQSAQSSYSGALRTPVPDPPSTERPHDRNCEGPASNSSGRTAAPANGEGAEPHGRRASGPAGGGGQRRQRADSYRPAGNRGAYRGGRGAAFRGASGTGRGEGAAAPVRSIDGEPWGPLARDTNRPEREERRDDVGRRDAPRGYQMDADGWWQRTPRQPRPPCPPPPVGRKQGTRLAAVPRPPPKARIFVSRAQPHITAEEIRDYVREISGADSEVERIQAQTQEYASFLVIVDKSVQEKVLDPDEWQEGLIVRPFRGVLRHHTQGGAGAGGPTVGETDSARLE